MEPAKFEAGAFTSFQKVKVPKDTKWYSLADYLIEYIKNNGKGKTIQNVKNTLPKGEGTNSIYVYMYIYIYICIHMHSFYRLFIFFQPYTYDTS